MAPTFGYNCRCTILPTTTTRSRVMADPEKKAALLKAVYASPADDLPRLVYADWLEENGDTPLALFIREQCESKKWVIVPPGIPAWQTLVTMATPPAGENGSALYPPGPVHYDTIEVTAKPAPPRCSYILNRGFVAGLVVPNVESWTGRLCAVCEGRGWHTDLRPEEHLRHPTLATDADVYTSFGSMRVWLCQLCNGRGNNDGVGWRMVREFPLIERVDTGRRPYPHLVRDYVLWYRATTQQELGGRVRNHNPADRCLLPGRVFNRLRGGRRVTEEVLTGSTFEAIRTGRPLGPLTPALATDVAAYPVTDTTSADDDLSAALVADAHWQNTPLDKRNPKEFFSLHDLIRY